ncbi:MAG: ABC transporter permease subunit [Armatimonas sp.]
MNRWTTVFLKEFLEVWRERRSIFQLVVMPLLITPLLIASVGKMTQARVQEARKETINVGIIGLKNSPDIKQLVDGQNPKQTQAVFVPVADIAQAESEIAQRKLRAVIVVPEDAQAALDEFRPVDLTVLNDPGNDESQTAAGRARAVFDSFGGLIVSRRLREADLPLQAAEPFRMNEKSVKGGGGAGMMMLTMFLPYILGLSSILGGIGVAFDAVAGEKERGTLETLLVSPISRRSIVTGKFLAVAAVALVNSIFSVIGMLWPFYVKMPIFAVAASGGLKLSAGAIAALFFVQMPVALLGAGVLLTISTVSRNQKEAQTSLAPVMLMASLGSMLTMLLKTESPLWWALVPITNAGLVLKQALAGIVNPTFVAVAFGSSLVYAAVAIFYARSVFEKESVLLKA